MELVFLFLFLFLNIYMCDLQTNTFQIYEAVKNWNHVGTVFSQYSLYESY